MRESRRFAQKDKQREAVIKMLRLLGRYVEVTSDGDMVMFTSSGFQPVSTTKVPPSPLPVGIASLPAAERIAQSAVRLI
jgi:hypothetical protein